MEENTIYTWKFLDEKQRGAFWYIIAISVMIWLVFWWIFTRQYWLSIVVLLASGLAFYLENNSQKEVEVKVTTLWISIINTFYEYSKINSFSFIYNRENAVYLRLYLNKKWIKVVNLQVDNKICEDLKQILPNFIKEEKDGDLTFTEKLISFLKL